MRPLWFPFFRKCRAARQSGCPMHDMTLSRGTASKQKIVMTLPIRQWEGLFDWLATNVIFLESDIKSLSNHISSLLVFHVYYLKQFQGEHFIWMVINDVFSKKNYATHTGLILKLLFICFVFHLETNIP